MSDLTIPALSIKEPHAHAIIHGIDQSDGSRLYKSVENRPWKTRLRGRFAIHACQFDPKELRRARELWTAREILGLWPECLVYGAIIGTVEIYDCVDKYDSPWFEGPYGFLLRDPLPIVPVPMGGALGFWKWHVSDEVRLRDFLHQRSASWGPNGPGMIIQS